MTSACTIRVRGVVQGVGFRPFVYRLARANTLAGWVLNGDEGVEIRLEGDRERVDAFLRELRAEAPAAASITTIDVDAAEPSGLDDFVIRASQGRDQPTAAISPDLAVCARCLRELFDPADPRFQYPYINCTDCGPRYSIILRLPYDRAATTMGAVDDGRTLRGRVSRSRRAGGSTRSRWRARRAGRGIGLSPGVTLSAAKEHIPGHGPFAPLRVTPSRPSPTPRSSSAPVPSSPSKASAATTLRATPGTPPPSPRSASGSSGRRSRSRSWRGTWPRCARVVELAPEAEALLASPAAPDRARARPRQPSPRRPRHRRARRDASVYAAASPALRRRRARPARHDERQPVERADRVRGRGRSRAPGRPGRRSPRRRAADRPAGRGLGRALRARSGR